MQLRDIDASINMKFGMDEMNRSPFQRLI